MEEWVMSLPQIVNMAQEVQEILPFIHRFLSVHVQAARIPSCLVPK